MEPGSLTSALAGAACGQMVRRLIAGTIAVLLLGYLVGVIAGWIHAAQRLGVSDLGVIVVVLLGILVVLQPELLAVVPTLIKVGNVEVKLDQLQRQQQVQREDLEDLRLVLELVPTDSERQILRELLQGSSQHTGSEERRTQLRRLGGIGLIRRRDGRSISEIRDGDRRDLAELVEVTDRGRSYLARFDEASAL